MDKTNAILIVDDEKNIRLTLLKALETFGAEIDTAVNGEEALAKLREKEFDLIMLDLRMPGIDGMEVLRRVRELRPDIKVIILTAFGTVERAVEAIQLGAVDFLQKPFVPHEIREIVTRVLDREAIDARKAQDFASLLELAKRSVGERHLEAAEEQIRRAISINPSRPEGFHLLGLVLEARKSVLEAQKQYRAALALDPTFEAARQNLHRLIRRLGIGPQDSALAMGPAKKKEE